jgi:hypothetical protein
MCDYLSCIAPCAKQLLPLLIRLLRLRQQCVLLLNAESSAGAVPYLRTPGMRR